MGIFNARGKSGIKAPERQIRVETIALQPKPKPKPLASRPNLTTSNSGGASRLSSPAINRVKSSSPYPSNSSTTTENGSSARRKRKAAGSGGASASPASPANIFDSDSDSDSDGGNGLLDGRRKKQKVTREDPNRRLTHPRIWTGAVEETKPQIREGGRGGQIPRERELRIVHAADLANLKQKCKPVLGLTAEEVAIELRYPGSRQRERYEIVYGKDKINAVEDIKKIVRFVYENFLSPEDATPFDPHTGFCRQLERCSSSTINDGAGFKEAIKEYNKRLFNLQKSGTIKKHLDNLHSLPSDLVAFIMNQVYDRAVAPSVEITRKYENGTDNVYGELHAPFISEILVERTKMTCDQVFVDLGSGVGQVVLQAALEIGCESWGCEQMETLKPLADDMLKEFEARCELWGVAPGRARLICGDFLQNERIHKALKRADVVLVNNQAFTSQLNDSLVRLFLDLKPGCKVVSLKSFVHEHKSASNDLALNLLDVEELTYPSDYVSWTDKGGTYCISTRK